MAWRFDGRGSRRRPRTNYNRNGDGGNVGPGWNWNLHGYNGGPAGRWNETTSLGEQQRYKTFDQRSVGTRNPGRSFDNYINAGNAIDWPISHDDCWSEPQRWFDKQRFYNGSRNDLHPSEGKSSGFHHYNQKMGRPYEYGRNPGDKRNFPLPPVSPIRRNANSSCNNGPHGPNGVNAAYGNGRVYCGRDAGHYRGPPYDSTIHTSQFSNYVSNNRHYIPFNANRNRDFSLSMRSEQKRSACFTTVHNGDSADGEFSAKRACTRINEEKKQSRAAIDDKVRTDLERLPYLLIEIAEKHNIDLSQPDALEEVKRHLKEALYNDDAAKNDSDGHTPTNGESPEKSPICWDDKGARASGDKGTQSSNWETTKAAVYSETHTAHIRGWPAERFEMEAGQSAKASFLNSIEVSHVSTDLKCARSLLATAEIHSALLQRRIAYLREQYSELQNVTKRNVGSAQSKSTAIP